MQNEARHRLVRDGSALCKTVGLILITIGGDDPAVRFAGCALMLFAWYLIHLYMWQIIDTSSENYHSHK